MADGTETTPKKPYKDRPVGLPNTEASRKILSEYEDAPPAWTAFLPNTQASAKIREEAMVRDMMARPDANAGTVTQFASGTTAAPSSTPEAQLTPPPPSAVGAQPVPFGSGEPALGSMTPLGPAVAPSQTPQLNLAQPTPPSGPDLSGLLGNLTSGAVATVPRINPTTTDPTTLAASYNLQNPGVTDPSIAGRAPAPTPQAAPVIDGSGARARFEDARYAAGFDDARIVQPADGRKDIYRSEQGVARRGGTEGYQGSIFEGAALDTARQLPGLAVPETNDVTRVVTDSNGRVVGYARQAASPEAAAAISRAANPNGIQTPELSPIEQRDYEQAVAQARQSSQERRDQPNMEPVFVPDGTGGTAFVNPNITRQRSQERAEAEAQALGVGRSLAISDWNQGRNPALNAISDAEVALAPGGFSSVGINPERRREIVDRGMRAELPDFLPSDMRDRQRARQEAFGPRLEDREREQAQLEGLSASPAFESAFGPMNDRTDRRLSDRQLREAIELARRLSTQTS